MKTLLSLLLMTAAVPALAQDKDKPADEGAKKKKVIRLDALTVEGKIQKPQAFYILQRSNLNFEDLNRPESFVPQVVESVDKQPF
ncbi:hypothetical protein SAMN05444354_101450 [Stigmatella aurantiaca]|uniref:Uncharacterized protein n=1 Tax=Stigmatella aurantiaca TaxID=41 RepID=A0A1H7GLE5_STIAU|nr:MULTISPECIES: hypothetical protein [Stigmatella]SEK38986.1 hypothetical protein SAMN05444354_101450 [Stigmatella aurantiaca]